MGHLQALDFVAIFAYCALMIFIGWWSSRKQGSTEEYFLGGRGMNPIVAGISIIASLVSSISYISSPGEMVKNGPGWMWQMLHAPISFAVIGYLVIPHLMKQPVTSAYELLEQRFGMGVRKATSAMFVLSRIFWMGLVIFSCSLATATITGLPIHVLIVGVGVVGMSYTIIGGIRAVMITDVVQFAILIGGAVLTIVYITVRCGGVSGWWPDWNSPAIQELNWPTPEFFTLDPNVRLSVVSVIIYGCSYWIMAATGDQIVIQRFLSTKDVVAARRSFGLSLVGDACTSTVLFLTGLALVGFYLRFPQSLPDASLGISGQSDKLFPHFIATVLPSGLTGLVVSAIFAAAMSCLNSGINSISTVLVKDFPNVFARNCDTDARQLRRAQYVGILVGSVAIGMSFAVIYMPGNNLLEITVRLGSLLAAPLFVAFAMAFFAKRSTPAGAWTGITVGALMGFLLTFWHPIVHALTGAESNMSITFIMPLSALAAYTAGVLVSRVTPEREGANDPLGS
jgi:SSS family solute:Na+ symporter